MDTNGLRYRYALKPTQVFLYFNDVEPVGGTQFVFILKAAVEV